MGTDQTAHGPVPGAGADSRLAGPTVVRMLLGGRLRRLREARGISREDAGEAIRASHSKISRLELGRTGFKRRDVADLLTLYGVADETERAGWLALVEQANATGWVHDYCDLLPGADETRLELEQTADLIRSYDVGVVPSLLQTEDYARAVIRLVHPQATSIEVQRRMSLLSRRQQVLDRPQPPRQWVIIDEAVLRRRFGGVATMRRQLEYLIAVTELPQVTVQLVPFSTGVVVGAAITMLRFAERELADVLYLDQPTGAMCLDMAAEGQYYAQVMDSIGIQAQRPDATIRTLHQILEETLEES